MKAESIEQIREHLAKGGMVLRGKSWGTTKRRAYMPPTALDDGCEYELLPLEEKEPEEFCDKCKFLSASSDFCEPCGKLFKKLRGPEPVDHGTQKQSREINTQPDAVVGGLMGWGNVDGWSDGTQKGQEERFRDSQKERMQRIRTRLMHGQWPEMQDLLAWWEATTGERIEWGRRCKRCDGTGKVFTGQVAMTNPPQPVVRECGCDRGYSVRPTWMEEGK